MSVGILSLVLYVASILFWNLLLKRNIGESMFVSWIVVSLLAKSNTLNMMYKSIVFAATQETLFAAMAFIYMASLMKKTGLVLKLVDILNSVFGRIAGGAGYVSTFASALFGMISGSGAGNSASVGSITIPWMVNSGWSRNMAATIVAGNAGLGITFPPSSTMFLLLGIPAVVAAKVTAGDLYVALMLAGIWTLLYRIILIRYFVRRDNVSSIPEDMLKPLGKTFAEGWTSLLIFLGILIPLLVTIGPFEAYLKGITSFGAKNLKSISIIVWIPIFIIWITIFEGRKKLPKTLKEWSTFNKSTAQQFSVAGATLFFAFAAGDVMTKLGLGPDMTNLLKSLDVAPWLMIVIVGIIITLVAGPLSSTATIVAVGAVAFSALTHVGVPPVTAAVAILMFSSTEGASPPSSAPIYIASGIAQVNPVVTFKPLVFLYVIPTIALGVLIALGILPI